MEEENSPQTFPILLLLPGLLNFVSGVGFGFASSTGPELMTTRNINEDQNAWYGSLLLLGLVFGGLVATWIIETLGRKTSLIINSVPFSLGWGMLLLAFHTDWTGPILLGLLYTGRFLTGVGGGLIISVYPVYLSECAPKNIRGLFSSSLQIWWELGLVVTYGLSIVLTGKWLAIMPTLVTLLTGSLTFLLMPESPSWLLKRNKEERARKALRWLRGKRYDQEPEITEILEGIRADKVQGKRLHLRDFKEKSFMVPLLVGLVLACIQSTGGMSVVVIYGIQVIREAGLTVNDGIISLITGILLLVFSFIPAALIDRFGRRVFLLISSSLGGISMLMVGLYFYLTEVQGHEGLNALSLTGILVAFASFSIGIGPVVFVVLGEIFPLRARGAGLGICFIVASTVAFIITKEFPNMKESFKTYGTFWFYAGVNFVGTFVIAAFVPKTKGKSLEEVEGFFRIRRGYSKPRVIHVDPEDIRMLED